MADTNALRAFSLIGVRVQVSLGALGDSYQPADSFNGINVGITGLAWVPISNLLNAAP